MIERLVPPQVVAVEAFGDDPGEAVFPGEEDLVAGAVPRRRREFVTTRRCAREALRELGLPPVAIRSGKTREPLWPAGVGGSLTPCDGSRAAAGALDGGVAAVGIDAEPDLPLPPEIRDVVIGSGTDPAFDRVVFSAKEALYKAWFPRTGRWLDFTEARVELDAAAGRFTAHLSVTDPAFPAAVEGRFLIERGLIVTAVVLRR